MVTEIPKNTKSKMEIATKDWTLDPIVPLGQIDYGFGYSITRFPYTPYSIYLTGTINLGLLPESPYWVSLGHVPVSSSGPLRAQGIFGGHKARLGMVSA